MMGLGFQELVALILIIAALSMTGIWPHIARALRELRGESVDEPDETPRNAPRPPSTADVDLSYRLLGISPSAPWEEIERAFRKKAHIHHPDHGGDEDTMRALNEAYSLLKKLRKK